MKRALLLIFLVLFLAATVSAKTFMISVNGNYFSIADPVYEELYGSEKYYPEGKISLKITGNLFVWGSYGFLSASKNWEAWSHKGVVNADLNVEKITDKTIMAAGIGFFIGYIEEYQFAIKIEAGICHISNEVVTDTSFNTNSDQFASESLTESGIGIKGNLGITYGFFKNFFAELNIGYLYATEAAAIEDNESIKLGGLKVALGIGIRF